MILGNVHVQETNAPLMYARYDATASYLSLALRLWKKVSS